MPQEDAIIRQLPAVRLAELGRMVASVSPDETSPLIGGLFGELCRRLGSAAIGLPVSATVTDGQDFQVVSLPPVERAAAIVHRGLVHGFLSTSQLPVRWVEARGYRFDAPARAVTLSSAENPEECVDELQAPVVTAWPDPKCPACPPSASARGGTFFRLAGGKGI